MLNRMPKASGVVTELVRKHFPLVLALIFIVGALLIHIALDSQTNTKITNVVIGGRKFSLEIANTPTKREKGLSDRNLIGSRQGMLFVFDKPSYQCFWMKNMRFNLDILWLDNANKLSYVQHNLSPASYPTNFCPGSPGLYVIEVNGGTTERLNLHIGDTIKLENH